MAMPTELDFSVLGVIARCGPVTAYAVRREFAMSAAPAWSSSAGSIYPAIKRLEADGLISTSDATDRRGARQLTISSSGSTALHAWLMDLSPELASPSPDPIRTRAQFVEALPEGQRVGFFDNSIAATQTALALLGAKAEEQQLSLGEQLGAEGAKAELQARLTWLERWRTAYQAG